MKRLSIQQLIQMLLDSNRDEIEQAPDVWGVSIEARYPGIEDDVHYTTPSKIPEWVQKDLEDWQDIDS